MDANTVISNSNKVLTAVLAPMVAPFAGFALPILPYVPGVKKAMSGDPVGAIEDATGVASFAPGFVGDDANIAHAATIGMEGANDILKHGFNTTNFGKLEDAGIEITLRPLVKNWLEDHGLGALAAPFAETIIKLTEYALNLVNQHGAEFVANMRPHTVEHAVRTAHTLNQAKGVVASAHAQGIAIDASQHPQPVGSIQNAPEVVANLNVGTMENHHGAPTVPSALSLPARAPVHSGPGQNPA